LDARDVPELVAELGPKIETWAVSGENWALFLRVQVHAIVRRCPEFSVIERQIEGSPNGSPALSRPHLSNQF
jgi:hypothetical protein